MTVYRPSPAPSFLRRRGVLMRTCQRTSPVREALLIAPKTPEASLAEAMLRLLHGYDIHVGIAHTLGAGLDQLLAGMPDILVLTDRLPPQDDAIGVLPILRRCGYRGPVVVIGVVGGRPRARALKQAGAADAIFHHEIDGARFAEAMVATQSRAEAA